MNRPAVFHAVVLSLLTIYGCTATVGTSFNYENRSELVIGKTSKNEALRLFDKPYQSSTVSNENGTFEILQYNYVYVNGSGGAGRILVLEFRNGVLNAQVYSSGFPEDATDFNYEAGAHIERTVSSKEDVINLMGHPSAVAMCPSTVVDPGVTCDPGGEVWAWMYTKKSEGLDEESIKSKTLTVIFDKNGIVSEVKRMTEI